MVLVVRKLALVVLSTHLSENARTVSVAEIPGSFIRSTILESHDALTMAETTEPFAFIGGSGCLVGVLANLHHFCRVATLPQRLDFNDSAPGDSFHGFMNQKLRGRLPFLVSHLFELIALSFATPSSLNLNDPVLIRIELAIIFIGMVRALILHVANFHLLCAAHVPEWI